MEPSGEKVSYTVAAPSELPQQGGATCGTRQASAIRRGHHAHGGINRKDARGSALLVSEPRPLDDGGGIARVCGSQSLMSAIDIVLERRDALGAMLIELAQDVGDDVADRTRLLGRQRKTRSHARSHAKLRSGRSGQGSLFEQ